MVTPGLRLLPSLPTAESRVRARKEARRENPLESSDRREPDWGAQ